MKRKWIPVILLAGLAALALWAVLGCPIRAVTGIPCPSCGLTRATQELLAGNFSASLYYHPLALLAYAILAAALFYGLLGKEKRKKYKSPFLLFFIVSGLIFLSVYIYRLFFGFIP